MASMTFRFTTECELTLHADSYEDVYLRLKDFMHGDLTVPADGTVAVYPPETEQMYFQLEQDERLYEIPSFKGAFQQDVARACGERALVTHPTRPRTMVLSQQVQNYIPDVYW